jgi:hypothetical protein
VIEQRAQLDGRDAQRLNVQVRRLEVLHRVHEELQGRLRRITRWRGPPATQGGRDAQFERAHRRSEDRVELANGTPARRVGGAAQLAQSRVVRLEQVLVRGPGRRDVVRAQHLDRSGAQRALVAVSNRSTRSSACAAANLNPRRASATCCASRLGSGTDTPSSASAGNTGRRGSINWLK